MEWLTPMTGIIAAAATVPVLVLMYFLKLKRHESVVPSTLLWKRAVQDLQVNAPFQKIRRNLLLLLQLLALVLILLALAGPVALLTSGPAKRYVLLIDRSASMNAKEGDATRLEAARNEAQLFIDSLRDTSLLGIGDHADRAMVIAFDDHARVMCNFTSDKDQLATAVRSITATDGGSSVGEAITMARAFSQTGSDEASDKDHAAVLVLYSDGRIRDLDQIQLAGNPLIFHCIGKAQNNVSVTTLQGRRSFENPEEVNVYTRWANTGDEAVTVDVQLSVDGDVRSVRPLTIPGRQKEKAKAGEAVLTFTLTNTTGGVLAVRQLGGDALACDDTAWTVLPSPKEISVLLVGGGNDVLEAAIRACPKTVVKRCSVEEFSAMDRGKWSAERRWDVVVLDRCMIDDLPAGSYLIFGQVPGDADVKTGGAAEHQIIVDWRERHPVLEHVNLTNLYAAKSLSMALPRDAEVLAEFGSGAAMGLVRRGAHTYLLVGFDVLETNWPFEPGFVLFCCNAIEFLARESLGHESADLSVGDPLVVDGGAAGAEVRLTGPDGTMHVLSADASGRVRYSGTERAGVYRMDIADQASRYFAVNVLNEDESCIEPIRRIVLSDQSVSAQEHLSGYANTPLWPWLAAAAMVLVCVEWIVYNYRNRI